MRAAAFLLHLLPPLLVLLGSGCFTCQAQKLVQEEVDALKQIGAKLRKNWDFSADPCTAGWVVPSSNPYIVSNLTCNCTSTTCHVVSIMLEGQNLTGELPAEFANLTQLSFLDLKRNYLNGTIPVAWASLPLTRLTLLGNRISGNIPDELGNMITLESLELDDNQLQGPIPATLGKLINLNRLHLSGNNFSGELPDLGNLKNMTDFRIDGNPISGKIPSFIGNWTQLQRLDMLGTSLEGPFPPVFATLSSITQLSVSDWKGGDSKFPPLQNMKGMESLFLRNLSISGQLPDYIGSMNKLDTLDLSFNNLSGTIPATFVGLQSTNYIFLTNNMLQGSIPQWILSSKFNLDVSYNNFTGTPAPSNCQEGNVNLMSSYSSTDNSISPCLQRNFPCSKKPRNYKLFINCGGSKVTSSDNEYEDDSSPLGVARYSISKSNTWASSSTGSFMDYHNEANYIATNVSMLNTSNPELYTTARLTPVSLKYYGLCLQKGDYNVILHFAEIMFTGDDTFSSVGKRLFDVSIQGQKVLHDFDIVKEANGTGKDIIKTFTASVDGTLEIHLYWAGKGTTAIPFRSVYGPLISAISVTPNFNPTTSDGKISLGAIVGIVVSVCISILLLLAILWIYLRRRNSKKSEFKGLELQTGNFRLKQIKAATRNFDPANKIGEGGFGSVYKGVLSDGSEIAVKKLSSKSNQGNREFVNEIGLISALEHPNLVKLYGCCIEGNKLFLIYEYLENNSLARALFGPERSRLNLNWQTRRNICLGIAKGLTYLHEESTLKIVHRDIKSTNVLLDRDLKAKISDFGLAKLQEEENTHISTRIAGTFGYMAPEYAMRGYLTDKADVYSYGIVTLEIVSGRGNSSHRPKEDLMSLVDWANILAEQGRLLELVDPKLESSYSEEEALQMLNLVLLCTNTSPSVRPLMSTVVSMLEGKVAVHLPSLKPSTSKHDDSRPKTFEKLSEDRQLTSGTSVDYSWTDSSVYHVTRIESPILSESRYHSDNVD